VRQTEKMKKAGWERTNQIPAFVESALRAMLSVHDVHRLPSQRVLEAGIRLKLRSSFRWHQVSFKWPTRELAVAEALMEVEDPLFVTVVIRPWKAKTMELPFTQAQVGLRTRVDEVDYDTGYYPEDSGSGDGLDSCAYPPVGAGVYEKDYDDHFERAFGEQSPSKRERDLDDWEWRFTRSWARGRGA